MDTNSQSDGTAIPSEQIILLLCSSADFKNPGSIWLRIEPRYSQSVNWTALHRIMEKVRHVVKPGMNPTDRFNRLVEELNEELERHSVVEVFGNIKPGNYFGREVYSV